LFWAGQSGASDERLNLYTFRVYLSPRVSLCGVFLGTEKRSADATVTEMNVSLVQDNKFCFGSLGAETPVLDITGTEPYILLTLGQVKNVKTVSIVGDWDYE
jgi:hypothetical protein